MLFLVKTLILLHCFIFAVTENEDFSVMSALDPDVVANITNENYILQLLTIFNRPEVALKLFQNIYFSENISAKCIDDFKAFGIGLMHRKTWAIQMLDSYGKIESGITQGNVVWPGRISVCKEVVQKFPNNYSGFRGQFCWLQISPKVQISKKIDKKYIKLRIGICIPDSCISNDLNFLLQSVVNLAIPSITKYVNVSTTCIPYTRNIWKDKQATICLMFLLMVATIILSGTVYNVYTQYFVGLFSNSLNKQNDEIEADIEKQTESREKLKNGLEFELEPESLILLHEENDKSFNTNNKISQIWKKILLCFSLYSNGIKLFNCKSEENSLQCLNGIRVLSMLWIILGHIYIICLQSQPNNVSEMGTFASNSFLFSIVIGALFSVDTFFVLGGLLITFLYLKKIEKENDKISWLAFCFHRYYRLTPVYAVVLIILTAISPYYSNSPLWPQSGLNDDCKKYWWTNLLYINNFLPMSANCFSHTWFLAVFMQFLLISPLILILLKRSTLMFSVLAGCLILTGWTTSGTIASYNHIKFLMQNKKLRTDSFSLLYEKPYCRIDTYIIGMICGYLLYRSKGQIILNKKLVILNWLIAALTSFSVIFGTYHSHAPQAIQSLYFALSRSTWAIALSWMIYACYNGYGGFINRILSWPLWQPLSRLTYSTYLIHTTIIHLLFKTSEITSHFSNMQIFINFIASTVFAYIAAILLSLSFEAPFISLEKLMLQKKLP